MDKFASLFRVFDLGFFIPGAVLFFAFQAEFESGLLKVEGGLTQAEGIASLARMITMIFVLGIACHGVQRIVYRVARRVGIVPIGSHRQSWYRGLESKKRDDLVVYFWYMRATAWNLSLAAPIALLTTIPGTIWTKAVAAILVGALLVLLGIDFHSATKNAVHSNDESPHSRDSSHHVTLEVVPPGPHVIVNYDHNDDQSESI